MPRAYLWNGTNCLFDWKFRTLPEVITKAALSPQILNVMTNDTRLIWATNQAVSSLLGPVRKQANNARRVKNKNPVPLKEIENAAGNLASRKILPLRGH